WHWTSRRRGSKPTANRPDLRAFGAPETAAISSQAFLQGRVAANAERKRKATHRSEETLRTVSAPGRRWPAAHCGRRVGFWRKGSAEQWFGQCGAWPWPKTSRR